MGSGESMLQRLVFTILFVLPSVYLHAEMSEKEIIDYVEKEVGIVIDKSEASEAYRVFEKLFEKLSSAQSDMVADRNVSMNRFYILSTPMVNAFVIPQKDLGKDRIFNRVFITTGVIKHMMNFSQFDFENKNYLHDKELQKEISYGILRIIGIISHELAHPLDNVQHDKISIHDHYSNAASQAIEIRADLEGAKIAEKAGFSVDAVYLGLSRLFGEEQARGMIDAVATSLSTHPSSSVRLSSQKLYLTYNRYETGLKTTDTPIDIKDIRLDEFVNEVYNFKKYYKKYDYIVPTSFDDAVKRLEYNVYKNTDSTPLRSIEINRLILSIDQMLYEEHRSVNKELLSRYIEVLYIMGINKNRNNYPIFNNKELHFKLITEEMSRGINTMRSHAWYLKHLPVFSDLRIIKKYLNKYPKNLAVNKYITKVSDFDRYVLSEDAMYKLISKRLSESDSKDLRLNALDALPGDSTYKHRLYYDIFYNKIKNQPVDQIIHFLTTNPTSSMGILPITSEGSSYREHAKYFRLYNHLVTKAKKGDKTAQREVQQYKEVMQSFLDHSKFWIGYELIGNDYNVDWKFIADVLGVGKDVIISRIHNQAHQLIRELSTSKRKSELYETLAATKKQINKDKILHDRFDYFTNKDGIQWLNKSTIKLLQAHADSFDLFAKDFFKPQINGIIYGSKLATNDLFVDSYKEKFKLIVKDLNSFTPYEDHKAIYHSFFGNKHAYIDVEPGSLALAQFKAMQELNVSNKSLKTWLKNYFMNEGFHLNFISDHKLVNDSGGSDSKNMSKQFALDQYIFELLDGINADAWFKTYTENNFKKVLNLILEYKIANSYYQLIKILEYRLVNNSSYFSFLSKVFDKIINEINNDRSKDPKLTLKWARLISPVSYSKGASGRSSFENSYQLREIKKALLEAVSRQPMDTISNYKLFILLTNTGATIESDKFFENNLIDLLNLKQIERALESDRIHSRDITFNLAKKILEPELKEIIRSKSEPSFLNTKIHEFLFKLNNLNKSDSFNKDKLLEDMAWRLELEGVRLSNFIEDEKTYNWRKANPKLVNMSSLLAEIISGMKYNTRYDFIDYLRNPDAKPELLDIITEQIYKSSYNTFLRESKADPNKPNNTVKQKAYDFSQQAKAEIESYVYNSSALERMPIYELILSAGAEALQNHSSYPVAFIRKALKFDKKSNDEKMLLTFLEMIPEHERTVSLAYLLSQSGGDKTDVKQLFKVFQSVGIKFGQLASIWNIFDKEVTRQLKELKDDAGAMDKLEVIEAVRSYMPKKEFEKIKYWRDVLGSASIKTVVEVELENGKRLALLVQNPNAKVQIESNIKLSELFIEGLKERGVASSSALFEGLVGALKEQIYDEIKFDLEAEKLVEASKAFKEVSKSLDLKGWKFYVPEVSSDLYKSNRVMALDLVKGVTFNKIPKKLKPEVGRLIVESSLSMLFMQGVFDPDRHIGNQIIDVKNKMIFPIDFGQMQNFTKTSMFSMDDRLVLAKFIEALSKADAKTLIKMAEKMVKEVPVYNKRELRRALKLVLGSNSSQSEVVTEVVEIFSNHGLKFNKKFMFGGLKGLIILSGEKYVSEAEFKEIMERQITKLYITKWPLLLKSMIFDKISSVLPKFKGSKKLITQSKISNKSKMLEFTHSQLNNSQVYSCRSLF